ncbi:MAG: hypothetical protein ACREPI_02180 [Candidatus Dormibacterales bacterium]
MKRLALVLAVVATAVGANVMPVGAAVWCQDDPVIPLALPITYSVQTTANIRLGSHWIYAWAIVDGSSYQHAAATIGLG